MSEIMATINGFGLIVLLGLKGVSCVAFARAKLEKQ